MKRCAGGGIILSSVVTRYQLGFVFHAGSSIEPLSAATPQGTCESAINAAFSGSTSAAKEAWNFLLSESRYPSFGGHIRCSSPTREGPFIHVPTEPPLLRGT